MEINIKNAFLISVKVSLQPFIPLYVTTKEYIHDEGYKFINFILQKPFIGTSIALTAIAMISLAFFNLLLVIGGVLCIAIIVILLEGLLILSLSLVMISSSSIILLLLFVINNEKKNI